MLMIEVDSKTKYAVIFTAKISGGEGYAETSKRMRELAAASQGYLGFEGVEGQDGFEISISYWADLEAIRNWRKNAEHLIAQQRAREGWYESYQVRIAKIEREYEFP
jgi:heme-degrading monooxygenase HmoA